MRAVLRDLSSAFDRRRSGFLAPAFLNIEKMTEQQPTKSSLERTLDLTVSAAQLKSDTETILRKRAKTAKVHGFRQGKVPMTMVRQMYGAQAYMDAMNNLLNKAYEEAVQAAQLKVAGAPTIEPKGEIKDDVDPQFTATVEVFPEVEVPDLSEVELKRFTCEVTDAEVEKTIEIMRKQRATFEEEADGVAAAEKRVTIDFVGKLDGEPFEGGSAKDFAFVIGAGQMLPDFEKAVDGMKTGEKKTFEMTFPADYVQHLAGKTVEFEVELKKVEIAKLPEVDAAFAEKLGITEGVEKMREEIANNLKREVKARITQQTKDGVMNALNAAAKFDLPKALVADEQKAMADAFVQNMTARGMQKPEKPLPVELFKDGAERRIRLGLLIDALVQKENLAPTEEEVDAHIAELAASYENPEEVKEWFKSDRYRMSDARAFVLENKVTEWALSKGKTTEEKVEFDKLMGAN